MITAEKSRKFTQSFTFKGLIIAALVLFLLIPQNMILSLIGERQSRSKETVETINDKWSKPQVVAGPILSIPYKVKHSQTETVKTKNKHEEKHEKITYTDHVLNIAPQQLKIIAGLSPEEKHYGIYRAILYKSEIDIKGSFGTFTKEDIQMCDFQFDKAYITLGLSDLKGVSSQVDFTFANFPLQAESSGDNNGFTDKQLILSIPNLLKSIQQGELNFSCKLNLNGSCSISFVPIGKNTEVEVNGNWQAPNFIGNFSPESGIEGDKFTAKWNILHFNRNIPERWIDYNAFSCNDSFFGVNLIRTVDHYQQNERSAKYAFMFIVLTFVAFFLVEVLTKKKIHPIQYLLVGTALILFYSLLLSISEQINFASAYLIASVATIGLITAYAYSIFKNKLHTGILSALLCVLYTFLFVILQLEDVALLIGSIGLFIILGVIMFVSRKINFYKQEV